MKDLIEFLPFVLPFARQASEPAAVSAIRKAAIKFCEESTAWRLRVPSIAVPAGNGLTPIPLPDGAIVQEVRYVDFMNGVLDPDTPENRRAHCIRTDEDTGDSPRLWGTDIDDEGDVKLRILPRLETSIPNALIVRLYVMPSHEAKQLPDFFLNRFGEVIGNGAVSILHSSNEEWAVPAKTLEFDNYFRAGCVAARDWANRASMRDSRHTLAVWR
jgi:hypothetical protein